jgi:hypothetical protein
MSLSFCWRNLSRRPLTPAENARCFRNRRRFFLGKVNNFVLDRFMFVLSTAKTARYCFGVLLRWAEAHFHVVSASTSLLWYGNKVQYGSVGVNLANEPHKKRDYLFPPDRYVPSPCQNTKFEKLSPYPHLSFRFPHVLTTFTTFPVPLRILFILSTYPHVLGSCTTPFCMPSPSNYYFLFTCLVFLVKSDKCGPTNLSAIRIKIFSKASFF